MKHITLEDNPHLLEQTLILIEKSFNYSKENSFLVDFNPLVSEENYQNCHLLIKDEKVIGHIGVLLKEILIGKKKFEIAMYGGIAIEESHRGEGLFKKFFTEILDKYSAPCMHMLWSDQTDMYKKFNFHACIDQFEYNQSLLDAEEFSPTKLSALTKKEIKSLYKIYNNQPEHRLSRSLEEWDKLKAISSTDLYIKRENDEIKNYFFINKGEDLQGVIIEVGDFEDFQEIIKYGVLWSPHIFDEDSEELYAALVRIGNPKAFQDFVTTYTGSIVNIQEITESDILFSFEKSNLKLGQDAFLTGVFGPNCFEELKELDPFYISGLDSI